MSTSNLTRRALLASAATAAAATAVKGQDIIDLGDQEVAIYIPENSTFPYEIQRTNDEWRDYFDGDDEVYNILRGGGTETPKTTDLWKAAHDGQYLCRGCDLPLYEGNWFQPLDKGWVFFHHAIPNSVMFGLDGPVPQYGQAGMATQATAMAEVHCRRCGSHVGHHLDVSGMFLHCINGTALKLGPSAEA